ncbi:MAG: radical SAM protein, partial [Myxococcales bacterium]|nr:radical SAM protein [Myxococcales bacterium]
MTGGEPFAFKDFLNAIVPGLIARTPHTVSVLTNLSAPLPSLRRFAALTQGRLGIVSASLHLETVTAVEFADKAAAFRDALDGAARFVVNSVLVPGRLDAVLAARDVLAARGLRLFPQLMKVGRGLATYDDGEKDALRELLGDQPGPERANVSPSYFGRRCWTGVDYFVLLQDGDAWSCRTARRHREGFLGNALDGTFALQSAPRACPWAICPCTVPANRGMIEGVGAAASAPDATLGAP